MTYRNNLNHQKMKKNFVLLIFIPVFLSCSNNSDEPDGWGNFEANETLISSEANGRILSFPVDEGDKLDPGQVIAVVDTTILYLQLDEITASAASITSRIRSIDSQNDILEQQIDNLNINISRVENMYMDGAASRKDLDDLTGQLAVLEKKILANRSQQESIKSELAVLDARKSQLNEQIRRCRVIAPVQGVILQKYAEEGELTATGKPLLKVADLAIMELKVYISGAQLSGIELGEECTVRVDKGESDYLSFAGIIIHISDKAEFTPKIIQTHDERVSMVYAVTLKVKNDGSIKSGMPGEVIFKAEDSLSAQE